MTAREIGEASAFALLLAWQAANSRMLFQIRDMVLKHNNTLYPNGDLSVEVLKHAQTLYGPPENRGAGLVTQVALLKDRI